MKMNKLIALSLAAAVAATSTVAFADEGEDLFKKKCGTCHTLDAHKIGPKLGGVVGRKAGSSDFDKYKALKGADLTWDEANLDAWISDSKTFAKEKLGGASTAMSVKISKEDDRKAIIEYLKGH